MMITQKVHIKHMFCRDIDVFHHSEYSNEKFIKLLWVI